MKYMKLLSIVLILFFSLSIFTNFASGAKESITVSAGDEEYLRYYLNDGDKMRYSITVDGGRNDDVNFYLKNPNGGRINSGLVTDSFSDTIYANTDGYYVFEFDNSFSFVSKKQVTLNYEIIKKPVPQTPSSSSSSGSSIPYMLFFGLPIIVVIIVIIVITVVRKSRNSFNEGYDESQNEDDGDYEDEEPENDEDSSDEQDDSKFIEILKKRYAKGEITKEEFDKMKEDLA